MSVDTGMATISLLQLTVAKTFDFFKLTKPKLTSLVLFTTVIGFYAGTRGPLSPRLLVHVLIGTALVAGGASAFNMYRERSLDARMKRTALRPLAAGRMQSGPALNFAIATSVGGFLYLFLLVNPLTGTLSAAISACYIFLYTPLKTRTWLCTIVGAVPGALPVLMGWTAAGTAISYPACVLFGIVFLWQIPHFFAIGWQHREDYARAGFPIMPVIDRDGRKTSRLSTIVIASLTVFSLLPYFMSFAGRAYLAGALVLGLIFLIFAIHFMRHRNAAAARRLFAASAFYLPALLVLLALDKSGI